MTLMRVTERDAVCKHNIVQLHAVGFVASRTGTGENYSVPVRHKTRVLPYAYQGHATKITSKPVRHRIQ